MPSVVEDVRKWGPFLGGGAGTVQLSWRAIRSARWNFVRLPPLSQQALSPSQGNPSLSPKGTRTRIVIAVLPAAELEATSVSITREQINEMCRSTTWPVKGHGGFPACLLADLRSREQETGRGASAL